MTTHQFKRVLNHPIINKGGLCKQAGLSGKAMLGILLDDDEPTEAESRKIEAYLKMRGIQWRDLIKEGL